MKRTVMITYTQYLSNSIPELIDKLASSNKRMCSRVQLCGSVLKKSPTLISEGFEILRSNNIEETLENLKLYVVNGFYTCQHCGKKFIAKAQRPYCSIKCAGVSELRQKRIKETNLKKYGVENVYQAEIIKKKIKDSFIKHHGFYGRVYLHLTNLNDLNKEYFANHFIKNGIIDFKGIQKYYNCKTSFTYRKLNEFGFGELISQKSIKETNLFEWIPCKNKVSGDRKILYPYELDILLPDYKLAIEYDGVYWHSDEHKDQNYHLNKTLECNNKGIQLFHIFETDDIDIWKSMISNKLGLNNKIGARKCTVKEITNSIAKSFCTQNHLQGACNAKINLGLFYNDELLEVMTFGKPRYNKHYEFELLRLCTKKYYSVIGGASKLWKCFCQKYSPKSVISYANRRFSNGNIYETLGFDKVNETKPNYWYVKSGELFSRLKFQKHKLKNILENYDEKLSEYENMKNNKYQRIFDCGNLVFEYIS